MQVDSKSKEQLISELVELHRRIDELETSESRTRESADALKEVEASFSNLLEHIPGISIQGYTTDGIVRYWNKASEEVYGYTAEEAIGRNLSDLIIPEELKWHFGQALEIGARATESGEFMPAGELMLLHKDGSLVPVYSIHTVVCLENRPPLMFCIDVDLSERKRAEEALRESNETLQALISASPLAIMAIDSQSRVTMWNPAAEEIFGWTEGEVLGQYNPMVPPGKSPEHQNLRERAFKGETLIGVEVVRQKKDATLIDVSLSTAPVYGSDGHIKNTMAVLEDISERKRAESALKESEEKFRALFEHIPGIAFVIDRDTRLIAANTQRHSVLGDDIGRKALERTGVSLATREFWHAVETQVIESGWPAWYTEIVRDEGKESRYYENRLKPIKKDGKVNMVIGVAYDVTERVMTEEIVRESEAELRRQSDHLEEVNAALKVLLKRRDEDKRELEEKVVTNVKEIVLPYMQRLKESGLNPQQKTIAAILEANLQEIVSPFVTRLSSRFVDLTPTELKVADLVRGGRTTKEIASLLNLSHNTILFHRHNIRGKLGLKKKKTNLRSYLRSLQD